MHNKNTEEFRYRSMATATGQDIVDVSKNTRFMVPDHERQAQRLLSELRHLEWGDFELFSATHLAETRISMRHSDDVIAFLLPSEGQAEILLKSRRTLCTSGAIAVPRSHCRRMKLEAGKKQIRIGIPSHRFHQHVKSLNGHGSEKPIKFDETPKLDACMLNCMVRLINAVFDELETSHISRALFAHKIEALELCLLAVWPNSLWDNKSDTAIYVAPRHVRSAIGIIHADPFTTFNIPDLAKACGVSIRTLQHGFRQFTSFSISEFITQVRLNTIQNKTGDYEYIESVCGRIGLSSFKKLNLEYKIKYGKNIIDDITNKNISGKNYFA